MTIFTAIKFIVTDGLWAKRTERSKRVSNYKFCLQVMRMSNFAMGIIFGKGFA